MTIDSWVESAGRWTAARTTRRSFLGRVGRVAVLVASGPAIATLLADDAEARVCGQTGVSPKCPTFDCNDIWGWCWYAVGCCAEGKLKKICDCCAINWPNVHGYCPAGTNVKCIVESCGTDPRMQTVPIERLPQPTPFDPTASQRERNARGGERVVIGNLESPLHVTVAAAFVHSMDLPLVLVPPGPLDEGTYAELNRMGARRILVAQPHLSWEDELLLKLRGYEVERIASAAEVRGYSAELAGYSGAVGGPRDVVAVETSGVSADSMPLAVALAHRRRLPIVVGARSGRAGAGAFLVGPEASAGAGRPGDRPLGGTSVAGVVASLGAVLLAERWGPFALVDERFAPQAIDLYAAHGMPSIVHRPGSLDGARERLYAHRGALQRIYLLGDESSVPPHVLYELQSIVNGFDAHLLIGVPGQGLPVWQQPQAERAVGGARGGNAPPPATAPQASKKKKKVVKRRRRRRKR